MNATLARALVFLVLAVVLLVWSVAVYLRHRTLGSTLEMLGVLGLCVVVLAHVAEGLHVLTFMRWGDPDSAGHYLDLVSAGAALILVPLGMVARAREKRRAGARP